MSEGKQECEYEQLSSQSHSSSTHGGDRFPQKPKRRVSPLLKKHVSRAGRSFYLTILIYTIYITVDLHFASPKETAMGDAR